MLEADGFFVGQIDNLLKTMVYCENQSKSLAMISATFALLAKITCHVEIISYNSVRADRQKMVKLNLRGIATNLP